MKKSMQKSWLPLALVLVLIAMSTGALAFQRADSLQQTLRQETAPANHLAADSADAGRAAAAGQAAQPTAVQAAYQVAEDGAAAEEAVEDVSAEEAEAPPQIARAEGSPVRLNTLLGCAVYMDAPDVKAGGDLYVSAFLSGMQKPVVVCADWYYDGAPMDGHTGQYILAEDRTTVAVSRDLEFSEDMPLSHTVGLLISYTDPATGHTERLYNEAPVTVHNYSKAYYVQKANEAAIRNASSASEVSCVYKGDYTSSYDVDYSTEVKTKFINEGGYSSRTNYLVWVNLATQKVNVFEGSQGNWSLIHTYRCATGAPATPTPTGVTYTTYKQTGWITEEYQVKNVTRFYPGSGYAFHSVLYTPDGSSVQSGALGYPKSHGCVRTEDAGVKWIYNNLPANSTVVIY